MLYDVVFCVWGVVIGCECIGRGYDVGVVELLGLYSYDNRFDIVGWLFVVVKCCYLGWL